MTPAEQVTPGEGKPTPSTPRQLLKDHLARAARQSESPADLMMLDGVAAELQQAKNPRYRAAGDCYFEMTDLAAQRLVNEVNKARRS